MSMEKANKKIKSGLLTNALLLSLVLLLSLLAGCSAQPENASVPASTSPSSMAASAEVPPEPSGDKKSLVATTTMLADLARQLGGEHLEVAGLMGPGIDPHLYQASAGDVSTLQNADIVLYNGLHLEGKMGEIFASLEDGGKAIICAENGLDQSRLLEDEDNPKLNDPHIWFDVSLWKDVATYTATSLMEIDPDNKDSYKSNLDAYQAELDKLDKYIKGRVEELPENQRVLVTAHDAFEYFGRAYDFEVRGLQGVSTEVEAATADMSELADFIASHKIKAIFIESSVPHKTIEALQDAVKAKGFEVVIGGELYSDSLGDPGTEDETYVGTLTANIDTIIDALK